MVTRSHKHWARLSRGLEELSVRILRIIQWYCMLSVIVGRLILLDSSSERRRMTGEPGIDAFEQEGVNGYVSVPCFHGGLKGG